MPDTAVRQVLRGQHQLFLDDHDLAATSGVTRRMGQPAKKGAVIRPNLVTGGAPQIRTGPVYDPEEKVYKLWTLTATDGVMQATGLHVSQDGVHWTQPRVGLVEVNGSRDNHYVSYPYLDGSLGPNSVVYDPTEEPGRRYKSLAYYRPTHQMVRAVSPDGVHWTAREGTLPSYDEFNLSYDAVDDRFLATVKVNGPHGRSHALTTSPDFETWTPPELIFHADDQDQELAKAVIAARIERRDLQQPLSVEASEWATDVYNFAVSRYEGQYIGFGAFFYHTGRSPLGRNHDGFHLIQLASSRDLKTWTRLGERKAFIGPSPLGAGAYDTMQLLPPSFPVLRGDDLWFYYTGLKHRVEPAKHDTDWAAVCLATLRRDGFIALEAADKGMVVTQPVQSDGAKLYVNADAADGQVRVDVLAADGGPLPSFSAEECRPLAEDNTRQAVAWGEGAEVGQINEPVRLRFTLSRARLYSYWFE